MALTMCHIAAGVIGLIYQKKCLKSNIIAEATSDQIGQTGFVGTLGYPIARS